MPIRTTVAALGLMAVAAGGAAAQSWGQESNKHVCRVDRVMSNASDAAGEWTDKQKTRVFELEILPETVAVTITSPHFETSNRSFYIVKQNALGVYAIDISTMMVETLAFSPQGASGSGEAIFSIQAPFVMNAWLMSCDPS